MQTPTGAGTTPSNQEPRKELGIRLRQLRQEARLTQTELGDKLDVTKQAISNWEQGLNEPDDARRRALADLFSVPIEEVSRTYDFLPDDSSESGYKRSDLDPVKLRETRQSLGLTLTQASRLTGLAVATLSEYETGKHLPSARSIRKLAEAYDTPLACFMKNATERRR